MLKRQLHCSLEIHIYNSFRKFCGGTFNNLSHMVYLLFLLAQHDQDDLLFCPHVHSLQELSLMSNCLVIHCWVIEVS